MFQAYRLIPKNKMERSTPWKWEPIRGQLKFSLIIAFTSSTWVLVTQTDKLILSKLLQLTDYAYFTISVLIASGISIVSGPISSALLPRLTKLHAENNEIGLISLYRSATQLVAIIAIPATFVLAVFAEKVLWVWTGDAVITMKAAPVLTLYALGNGILAIGAFPYYLQFAKGDLNLHLIGSALFVCFLLPFLFVATWKYGMIGPGYAWLGTHLVFFIFWLPIVHRHLSKGLHYKWLFLDLGPIFIISSLVICAIRIWSVWPNQRFSVGVRITEVSLMLLVVSAFGSSWIREAIRVRWRARFAK